jgi:hypothetical protein
MSSLLPKKGIDKTDGRTGHPGFDAGGIFVIVALEEPVARSDPAGRPVLVPLAVAC